MKRTKERAQFLADTVSTAIEGGVGYWAIVTDYKWGDGEEPFANATLTDAEDEDSQSWEVTIETAARGWDLYKGQSISGAEYGKQAMLANRTNGEDGDYDADVADNVIQLGLFGEIIYS